MSGRLPAKANSPYCQFTHANQRQVSPVSVWDYTKQSQSDSCRTVLVFRPVHSALLALGSEVSLTNKKSIVKKKEKIGV